jgi:hypothetical protein
MHLFLSYRHESSTQDASSARAILESSGVWVWQDQDGIEQGGSITGAVNRGLNASIGAVVFYGVDYLESNGCFLELASQCFAAANARNGFT